MNNLKEKTISITFKIAGYDLEDIDFTALHNTLMLKATEELSMFAVVGAFTSCVDSRKDKKK